MTRAESGKDAAEAARPQRVVILDGTAQLPADIIGNKGYGIDAMRRIGLPVPPAFCITTAGCDRYFAAPATGIEGIWRDVLDRMAWLQGQTSRTFGAGPRPLLVSVRSSPAHSMPGMLDTVLNLGIDDAVEKALAASLTAEFARDCRDRFQLMYRRIVSSHQESGAGDTAGGVPDDPYAQLRGAIEAVFASWNSPRAESYRRHHGLDDVCGTAVVVQAMVFGNMNARSGTGVLFSRNPITGASDPFGEWLPRHQGEDIVSGTVDCEPMDVLCAEHPPVYRELMTAARTMERLDAAVQDIEFTVEDAKLWLVQTRSAVLSAQATVRLALALRNEGLIDDRETLRRVTPAHIETLLSTALQPETTWAATLLARGLAACPGVASGTAYTDVDAAIDAADRGEDVILVRISTGPDDVHAMLAARGIVTEVGGATSHTAVVSRELGRPSVMGCGSGTAAALTGRVITVDGGEGEVREGILEVTAWSENTPELHDLADIARTISPLRAHSAGDYPLLPDSSEDTLRAALAAGYNDVVCSAPLIAMLMAARLTNDQSGSQS